MADIEHLKAWRDAYIKAHEEVVRWTAIKDQAKDRLRSFLEDEGAEVGTIDGSPAVRLTRTGGRFDSKRFAKDHPELYALYKGDDGSRFEIVETAERAE